MEIYQICHNEQFLCYNCFWIRADFSFANEDEFLRKDSLFKLIYQNGIYFIESLNSEEIFTANVENNSVKIGSKNASLVKIDDLTYMDFDPINVKNLEMKKIYMEKENNLIAQPHILYRCIEKLTNDYSETYELFSHYLIDNRKKYEINIDYIVDEAMGHNSCLTKCMYNNICGSIAMKLIKEGADLKFINRYNTNLAMKSILCKSLFADLFIKIETNYELLNREGKSLLFILIDNKKHDKITEEMIIKSRNVLNVIKYNPIALECSIFSEEKTHRTDILFLMLKHGGNPNSRFNKFSCLDFCLTNIDAREMLLTHGSIIQSSVSYYILFWMNIHNNISKEIKFYKTNVLNEKLLAFSYNANFHENIPDSIRERIMFLHTICRSKITEKNFFEITDLIIFISSFL